MAFVASREQETARSLASGWRLAPGISLSRSRVLIMSEKKTGLALLREPFPEHQISKLPKPTVSNDQWKLLPKSKCTVCGGYHPKEKTIHLDYVGHAALTDRLLDADPSWTWEPLAIGPNGLPVVDGVGALWIKLTVCGVTRLGYGDAQGKTGGNAMKECIGDALRNAAMRFGAALELWHKGDLHLDDDNDSEPVKPLPESAKSVSTDAWEKMDEAQQAALTDMAMNMSAMISEDPEKGPYQAVLYAQNQDLSADEKVALNSRFGPKERSAMKSAAAGLRDDKAMQP